MLSKLSKTLSAVVAVILLSSCAICGTTTAEVAEIPTPPPLVLPKLTQQQDLSIPDDVYEILVVREQMLKARNARLIELIKTQNERLKQQSK